MHEFTFSLTKHIMIEIRAYSLNLCKYLEKKCLILILNDSLEYMLRSLTIFYYAVLYKISFLFKEILETYIIADLQISRNQPTSVIHKFCIEILFEHCIRHAIIVPEQWKMQAG